MVCSHRPKTPIEELGLFDPYLQLTKRSARNGYKLSKTLTGQEVSRHLGLEGKTVKAADQKFLEEKFGQTDYRGLRLLAVNEISIRKGNGFLISLLDYGTGRVVWVREDRRARTLLRFFSGRSRE